MRRRAVLGLAIAAALAGLLVAAAAPRLRLPAPTGAAPIGTREVRLPGQPPITLWYPARATAGRSRAVYANGTAGRSVRERLILPLVRTAAFVDADAASGLHPVVLYTPGWGERRFDNTALCEDLASHGFIVAAIDDLRPLPPMDFSDADAYRSTLAWANEKVRLQSRALSALLHALQHVSPDNAAYDVSRTLDVGRVAAVGYSFGGASAAELAIVDPRVRAAVNLDGWIFGRAAREGVGKPFMIVGTGAAAVDPTPGGVPSAIELGRFEAELDRINSAQIRAGFARNGGYYVSIDGTRHESFTDAALLPLRLRRIPGTIEPRRAQRIIAAYVYDFLALALNGSGAPLLTPPPGSGSGSSRSTLDRAATVTIWTTPSPAGRISG